MTCWKQDVGSSELVGLVSALDPAEEHLNCLSEIFILHCEPLVLYIFY